MVKHIVFWKLKDELQGAQREQVLKQIKEGFEALQGVIPGMTHIEIGVDFSKSSDSGDIVLYSEFESRAALDGYQNHPGHLAMVPIVREWRVERRVVDYDI
jgi:quinol monooxygenase YgiN